MPHPPKSCSCSRSCSSPLDQGRKNDYEQEHEHEHDENKEYSPLCRSGLLPCLASCGFERRRLERRSSQQPPLCELRKRRPVLSVSRIHPRQSHGFTSE